MSLKTLVKHAYKLLPQTDRMSEAVTILNQHEGLDEAKAVALRNDGMKQALLNRLDEAEKVDVVEGVTIDGEIDMTPEERETERKRLLAEYGTEAERKQSGLFSDE